jgi:peptidoglycan/LPS O-acetylase OafA/YrhL
MTVKPLVERTAPVGIAVLGFLVIATGWFLIEGLPFVLGCLVMCALAAAAIVLSTSHLRDS